MSLPLPTFTATSLVQATLVSHSDYCNGLLTSTLVPLQSVFTTAARGSFQHESQIMSLYRSKLANSFPSTKRKSSSLWCCKAAPQLAHTHSFPETIWQYPFAHSASVSQTLCFLLSFWACPHFMAFALAIPSAWNPCSLHLIPSRLFWNVTWGRLSQLTYLRWQNPPHTPSQPPFLLYLFSKTLTLKLILIFLYMICLSSLACKFLKLGFCSLL